MQAILILCTGLQGGQDNSKVVGVTSASICPNSIASSTPLRVAGAKHTRAHCSGSIVCLRKIVPVSLDNIPLDMLARLFGKTSNYESAYREGHSCETVDKAVKMYKSHHRVTSDSVT